MVTENGDMLAAMPIENFKKIRDTICFNPPFCQYVGIFFGDIDKRNNTLEFALKKTAGKCHRGTHAHAILKYSTSSLRPNSTTHFLYIGRAMSLKHAILTGLTIINQIRQRFPKFRRKYPSNISEKLAERDDNQAGRKY